MLWITRLAKSYCEKYNYTMKVVLLINSIPPYRVDFFRELSYLCDLTVVCDRFLSPVREYKQDKGEIGFDYVELGQQGKIYKHKRPDIGFDETRVRYNGRGVTDALKTLEPYIVITCEFGMRSLFTALYCRRKGVPYIVWSEGTRYTEKGVNFLKSLMRKSLACGASGYWTNGTASKNYLEDLGANAEVISEGMTGVATKDYYDGSQRYASEREKLRGEYGMVGSSLLFVGAISERKGVLQLMQAIEKCDAELSEPCCFVLAGSGPLHEDVESLKKKLKYIKIILPGFQDQDGIQKLFAACDVFVMPTLDDNWPLVTIEAMVSGVPQIGSIYNGASEDLAKTREIGVFIDPHDIDDLAGVIREHFMQPPSRLSDETVKWATEFYSPESQAKRAHELILKIGG